MLEQFIKLRNGSEKDVRLIRQSSHLDKEPKVRGKYVNWKSVVVDILIQAGRFMSIDEVFSTIEAKQLIQKPNKFKFKDAMNRIRYKTYNDIIYYKDKLGLSEWMENNLPKPEFIKQFMYAAS